MGERFELFRLSLVPRDQKRFFEEEISREEYLRRAFSRDWIFQHYGTEFHYRSDAQLSHSEALLGRLGRQVTFDENLPPEKGFAENSRDGWKACVLALDPRDHADGQKAALQIDRQVGTPYSLMISLAEAINQFYRDAPFQLEIQPIFDSSTFWRFAEENRGQVTSLTFEFVVPNGLWSANESVREGLARYREKISAQKVTTTFKSNEGLETDAEPIREAVSYAEKGSGSIKARALGNKRFSSKRQATVVTLDDSDSEEMSLVAKAARKITQVLGRE
ncbi:hypothetical protein [Microvirga splendida]|uniref:Uncharacterized protein n=1 Tax=Microvirga splendida TaxID=2795727 RepID=A0ABS0Y5N1_9HYPH|nr:hypothetical protein [Microvirga splendida]MBJ6127597.1 hypothetical protein [Microvirga splendida]